MKRLSARELRRAQERMLKNLGLDVEELGVAEEVVVKLANRQIVIRNPAVYSMKTAGEHVIQVVGGEITQQTAEKQQYTPSEEDVMLVASQTGVSEDDARKALVEAEGDLAKAILSLRSRR
ncbi:MAG: nascent polypeptide-associated complex protein [Candidatus Caldarchaeum sp.]|nr:nascent polypeptide-associated complex protein [Candidatus Caldarchaeum sp.]MDW7977636.1 nascent polypeptide-associated complex protein [Candidatus Caldarchaeum sp.]